MFMVAAKAFFSGLFAYIGAALTFLTTKPGVYLLIAGVAAGAYWYSGHEGYKRAVADDKAAYAISLANAQADAMARGIVLQANVDKGIQIAADNAAKAREADLKKTIANQKRIPAYVTPETDRAFAVPCGLYRLLRAAADDDRDPATVDLPAGLSDGDACPLTASDLADNGLAIIGRFNDAKVQIAGLQDLARTLKAAAEK
jgi:hypothetical protein